MNSSVIATLVPILSIAALAVAHVQGVTAPKQVEAVPSLDLKQYAGKWFEIARVPNRFQTKCLGEVTAEYTLRDDGRVTVVNSCRVQKGTTDRAEGIARLANEKGPASKLKVRFAPAFLSFLSAVWGDYWVIALPADYRYAVVGSPSREYLWILSRSMEMLPADYDAAVAAAVANGFDVSRLVKTRQSG